MRRITLAFVFALSLFAGVANATVFRIPEDVADIQYAIENSHDGDTILIARGRYYIHLRAIGRELTFASHYLLTGDEADVPATIITGIEGTGPVMHFESWQHTVRVVGLTITGGKAVNGGGIFCQDGRLIVDHCTFTADSAQSGGGFYARNSVVTLTNSRFENNRAINGGGVFFHSVNLTMYGCRIERNRAFLGSGMLFEGDSAATIDSCFVTGSMALEDGGGDGMALNGMVEFPPVIVKNCEISGNVSEGIVINQRAVTITDSRIMRNMKGGISIRGDLTILRCLIYANQTTRGGGGVRVDSYGRTALINSVVYGNEAQNGGGVYTEARDSLVMVNSILWGNRPNAYLGVPYILYCDITGGAPGEGNINIDPRFVSPDAGNFRLQEGSRCIDAGLASFEWVNRVLLDLDSTEYVGAGPDIGAFEFGADQSVEEPVLTPYALELTVYPNPFNGATRISFDLAKSGLVDIGVFDLAGRRVATVAKRQFIAGENEVVWDAERFTSGLYFVKITTSNESLTSRIVLVK